MTTEIQPVGAALHRRIADELFRHTWSLIERTDRTPDDDADMVNAAHAGRWHWARAEGSEPSHLAIAEWQIAHVYAITGRAGPAGHHAQASLRICRENRLGDYLLAYAYEALARAAAVSGDDVECEKWLEQGWSVAEQVSDAAVRERLEADLASIRSA